MVAQLEQTRHAGLLLLLTAFCATALAAETTTAAAQPALTQEHIVFQTTHGDIEMVLYPEVGQSAALQFVTELPALSYSLDSSFGGGRMSAHVRSISTQSSERRAK